MVDPVTIATGLKIVGSIIGHNTANKAQQKLEKAFEQAINNNNKITQVASDIYRTGYETALRYNSQGMTDAANAAIGYTNKAIQTLFDQTNVASDIRRRFMASADQQLNKALSEGAQYLEPFWDAGIDAMDEMQAMLGIGDHEFDPSKITETPGYKHILDQSLEAIDKSAVGTKLSGAQAQSIAEFSAGHAEQYYQTFMKDLDNLVSKGLTAGQSLADLSKDVYTSKAELRYKTGKDLGDDAMSTGINAATILRGTGSQLAGVYQTGNRDQARLSETYYDNEGNLRLNEGKALNDYILAKAGSEAKFGQSEGEILADTGTDLARIYSGAPTQGSGAYVGNPSTGTYQGTDLFNPYMPRNG